MLKELHDAALEDPRLSNHDKADCPLCTPVAPETSADAEGGSVTHTEEEFAAAATHAPSACA